MSEQHQNQYQAGATDLSAIRDICERHGFCLVKGVLDPGDLEGLLAGMRAASRADGAKPIPDLLSLPQLRHIYFDPRLLAIARALLGPRLVYDGESNVNFEETIGAITLNPYAELHCDAKGMPDDLDATWRSATDSVYRAYRFGIYFWDYRRASGALKVIVGSHRGDPTAYEDANLFTGGLESHPVGPHRIECPGVRYPLYNLPSEPGDVVIWNLRTFHSAGAKLFADDPAIAVHPKVEGEINAEAPSLFAPPPGPRNALFFDYAAPCEEIDLYIKARGRPTGPDLGARLDSRSDEPEVRKLADDHGVSIRHDALITALALVVVTNASGRPVRKLSPEDHQAAAVRLYELLRRHVEYSPHFPLFDRERFERAAGPNAALNAAMDDISRRLLVKA